MMRLFMVGDALIHSAVYQDAKNNDGTYEVEIPILEEVFSKFDVDFPDMYDEDNYKILETVDVNNLNKAMSIARGLFSKDVIDEDYDDYVTDDDKDSSKKVVRFQLVDHKKGRGI